MFTRVLEITSKAGKMKELSTAVTGKIIPILKTQPGFVEEIVLLSTEEPNRMLSLGFWQTEHDAESFETTHFDKINDLVKNLLETRPVVRQFNVESWSQFKITAGRAA